MMDRLWRCAIVALATTSLSCNLDAVAIELDASLTSADRGAFEAAIRTWQSFASRAVYAVDGGEWLALPSSLPNGVSGYTQRRRHLIRIGPEASLVGVYPVALHELGHTMGLRHICRDSNPTSIGEVAVDRPCDPSRSFGVMDPSHHTVLFTEDDLAECRRVGAC